MPMNKVRWGKSIQSKDEQYELKRAAILRTAGRLFNQKGFRETSLNDLADELQVTKPTLYYYVENKEDILFQCLHTAIIELLEPAPDRIAAGYDEVSSISYYNRGLTLLGLLVKRSMLPFVALALALWLPRYLIGVYGLDIATAGIAYVPENMGIFTDLTVKENMVLAARAALAPQPDAHDAASPPHLDPRRGGRGGDRHGAAEWASAAVPSGVQRAGFRPRDAG